MATAINAPTEDIIARDIYATSLQTANGIHSAGPIQTDRDLIAGRDLYVTGLIYGAGGGPLAVWDLTVNNDLRVLGNVFVQNVINVNDVYLGDDVTVDRLWILAAIQTAVVIGAPAGVGGVAGMNIQPASTTIYNTAHAFGLARTDVGNGFPLSINGCDGNTDGDGGTVALRSGNGVTTAPGQNNGANMTINTGNGAAVAGGAGGVQGGNLTITLGQGAAVDAGTGGVGGGLGIILGSGAAGAGGAGNGGNFSILGGVGVGAGLGSGLAFTGGAGGATGFGGTIAITSGASGGVGGTAGQINIRIGDPAGGARGSLGIGDTANSGIITMGNTGSLSALNLNGGNNSTWQVADGTLLVQTTRITDGIGPNITITAADGLAAAPGGFNGGSIFINTGDANASGVPVAQGDGGNLTILLGNGDITGAAGPMVGNGGAFQITGGNGIALLATANGGGFTFIGGNASGVAPATGGGFTFTGGSGDGGGSTAGGVAFYTGIAGGGTPGSIVLGDINVGAISLGSAGSAASTVNIESTAAMLLRSTLSTIELRTTGVNNISINPGNAGAARAFTDLNNTGIINGRWESSYLQFEDDFIGTVLRPDWTPTINGGGGAAIAMCVGADSTIGGAVKLTATAAAENVMLSTGTNRFVAGSQVYITEVRIRMDVITQVRLAVILHEADNGIQAAPVVSGGAYYLGGGAGSDWVGLEYVAAAGASTWLARGSNNGGAVVDVNTGIAPVAGTYQTLRMEYIVATATVNIYIDGVPCGTIAAARVPLAAVLMEPRIRMDTNGNAGAVNVKADFVKVWQAR